MGTHLLSREILFKNLKLQTWAIPKYRIQYFMKWQRETINNLIEEAIMEADQKGIKVLSLGFLNQASQRREADGELYIRRNPRLKVKVVDGSSLASAVVVNSIPKGTSQFVLRGHLSKVAYSIALACQGGIQTKKSTRDLTQS
ncbi:very-long-chain aldehyde decarbonylase CER1-like isoform X2 [Nicotiana tabacum]|uniref:Very-long-chain aldehyde decarbonylase CER1-like isoform X2 n=1 Tax=Nicotiana tabacum TaxID=4097 RepID=A0AC58UUN9_TOBAC